MNLRLTAVRSTLAMAAVLGVSLAARNAAAAMDCTQDTDCSKGFTCQAVSETTECVAFPCSEDGSCPPAECDASTTTLGCLQAPCGSDSDCGPNMVCYAQIPTLCGLGGCPTTPVNLCTYKYNLPCAVDSDCGSNFRCVPNTITVCDQGDAAMTSDDAAASPPSFPVVTCTTPQAPGSSCEPDAIACSADSDCPASWTCVYPPGTACAGPANLDGGVPTCGFGQQQCEPPGFASAAGSAFSPGGPQSPAGDAAVPAAGATGTGLPVAANGNATGDGHNAPGEGGSSCQLTGVGMSPARTAAPWALLLGLSALLRRSRSRRPVGGRARS
jgi:hypothetical protein